MFRQRQMSTDLHKYTENNVEEYNSLNRKQDRICDKFFEFIMRKFHRSPSETVKNHNCKEMNTVVSFFKNIFTLIYLHFSIYLRTKSFKELMKNLIRFEI
jgi:hypothetical protein